MTLEDSPDSPDGGDPAAPLPPLYARWLGEALGELPASEPAATCLDCAMCEPASPVSFRPDLKCCSFVPDLPNFRVGGLLADPDAALEVGRAAVRARIAAGVALTPLGLGSTPAEDMLRSRGGERSFGASAALRCPYFVADEGLCAIWRYREATCSTWFCKHERGLRGEQVWRAVQRLIIEIEATVATWCLLELELDPDTLDTLFPAPRVIEAQKRMEPDPSGVLDEATLRAAWGAWYGREEELFVRCAELAAALDWDAVRALGDPGMEVALRVTRASLAGLEDPLPEHLVFGNPMIAEMRERTVDLMAYSPYDPLRVPRRLFDALHHFDGRPTAEALRAIELEEGLRVDEDGLRRLVDFGLLVEAIP